MEDRQIKGREIMHILDLEFRDNVKTYLSCSPPVLYRKQDGMANADKFPDGSAGSYRGRQGSKKEKKKKKFSCAEPAEDIIK